MQSHREVDLEREVWEIDCGDWVYEDMEFDPELPKGECDVFDDEEEQRPCRIGFNTARTKHG